MVDGWMVDSGYVTTIHHHPTTNQTVLTLPLIGLAPATPRSRLLTLDIGSSTFSYQPGQAIAMAVHGREPRRPYSIACSPEQAAERGAIEVLVGTGASGELGDHLEGLAPGAAIDVEGPFGSFVLPEAFSQPRLLFVAGGSGISPLRAMIDRVLRRDRAMVSVLYSARRADEFAFVDELRQHAANGRLELHQTVTRDDTPLWPGSRGRISRSHFAAVLREPADTLCFVCGPASMVNDAVAALGEMGVPGGAIRIERWGY